MSLPDAAVLAVIAAFVFYHRKRSKRNASKDDKDDTIPTPHGIPYKESGLPSAKVGVELKAVPAMPAGAALSISAIHRIPQQIASSSPLLASSFSSGGTPSVQEPTANPPVTTAGPLQRGMTVDTFISPQSHSDALISASQIKTPKQTSAVLSFHPSRWGACADV